MTTAAEKFRGSIMSACVGGLVGPDGLTDAGRQTADRLADDAGEDREQVRREIEAYLAAHPAYTEAELNKMGL